MMSLTWYNRNDSAGFFLRTTVLRCWIGTQRIYLVTRWIITTLLVVENYLNNT